VKLLKDSFTKLVASIVHVHKLLLVEYFPKMSKSALIFGASGVTGWAFVNEILNDYPKKGIWKNVHALTNRPLKREDSEWPSDPRLEIVSGIDLLKGGQSDLERDLETGIEGLSEVTHVYYLGMFLSPNAGAESEHRDVLENCR